eukprot:TRINITY_DN4378_c0_g1_i1.p1 TRINITY_DN4378_c0_g1~~TRINITY_DN4378_c0_g1_i1.p1  ORF type:complete len:260 (-),score=52.74 TRINITY_DN4378_c0_g1_i1:2-781(-)
MMKNKNPPSAEKRSKYKRTVDDGDATKKRAAESSQADRQSKKPSAPYKAQEILKSLEDSKTLNPSTSQQSQVDLKYVQQLETKYRELHEIRVTEQEKLYELTKQTSRQKEEAMQVLIDQLKVENARLQQQLSESSTLSKKAALVDKLQTQLADAQQQVAQLKKATKSSSSSSSSKSPLVAFYETITSLKVEDKGDGHFVCSTHGNTHKARFEVQLGEEVEYSPITTGPSMPECLAEDIYFPKEEWPVFLSKLLTSVYKP